MKRLLALAVVLALGLVAGCGGGSAAEKKARSLSPSQRLAAAQKYLDDAKAVTIALSTPKLPKGTQGILKATGVGTKAPAFEGKISVVQSGLSVEVPVIAVDGDTYIKFGGSYQKIDPDDFGAPDPASLFTAGGGLSSVLSGVKDLKKGKDTREGKQVLSTLTGRVAGSKVGAIIPSAENQDFDATFTLDSTNHLVTAKIKGPFYPGADDVTYTVGFSRYGKTVKITKP
ncbi:LppX_LprAFG lipoprotein [Nocardioides mangrovicus]|uniref:LppX_LprAFG lipoprotein n=1 Tax=Nocardioides mangrovicus TaxID=2478913 RepID=UPI0013141470|nr:LppX_LprAFG lipoprotein [Nocardioides mangrovicus]